jgi:DMSO/TMAO reductase YedYZ molybdopterin-dependent catalytic subunit
MFNAFKRKENEEKMRLEGRLPPGQSLTQKFPVLHVGPVPKVDFSIWDLKFWGLLEEPLTLNWEQFNHLPRTKINMDLHCVTKWSMFDSEWEGVALRSIIDAGLLNILPQAKYVLQHAEYGYTTNLPLKVMLQDNFLLATHYNGEPIPLDHGYPLRAVIGAVPGRDELEVPYLWKGAKWLRGLEFLSEDQMGFWEEAGYHNRADVWKEERTI